MSYQEKKQSKQKHILGWVCMSTYVNVIDCTSLNKVIIIEKERCVSSKYIKAGKRTFDLDRDFLRHVVMGWQGADGNNLQNQPWRLLLKGYWTNKLISFVFCFIDLLNVDITNLKSCGEY